MTRLPLFASLNLALLLGASQTLVQAASLALAMLAVLLLYSLIMLGLRRFLHPTLLDTASILLAAGIVSCLELGLRAWALEIYQGLGLYLALISLNCLLLERNVSCQSSPSLATVRPIAAYGALLLMLGLCRELLASGTLSLDVGIIRESSGLRLATLAPGGFILLGLLIAAYRSLSGDTNSPRTRKETLAP
ncbi:Rnf-Nqr domain containing protein [Pseudomonas akapageensis]|uniref:Rnf-Nqr domain containing protein n=1 Tax=Pseudomonas akapageensis TaxID=2609961 RepID=UPI00140CC97A|nr:Rnf-Nqr domain containing protein [Pseudomonas akapageensis]